MAVLVWVCRTCRHIFRREPSHICPHCTDAYSVDPHALIPLSVSSEEEERPRG